MTPRRLKTVSLLAGVLLPALMLLAWTQPWFMVELGAVTAEPVPAGGDVAGPALPALALAGLALVAAMAIAGTLFRVVLAAVQTAIGFGGVIVASAAIANPVGAVSRLVTDLTGVSGESSLRELVTAISPTPWPWLAMVSAALLAALGILNLVTTRRWPGASRKYERSAPATVRGAASDWDALSEGNDPTEQGEQGSASR
ncbi:Trp biosynthesis-associated membrane protein [Cryobacterium sp. BB736]|uniref:Trp biosynthesis-associated membrane protein n=1 Tax=Cryobacterium sp. BB736 TaxID=2746963 RepID=UPI0018759CC8|nr:Trp biosynthesis-associated membrane protein [Cryobacterium sp. BB736]